MTQVSANKRHQTEGKACEGADRQVLLSIKNLVKDFILSRQGLGRQKQVLRAVDNVSIDIMSGETFGLVGESGCGKSTIARCLMLLERPTSGQVVFSGEDILALSTLELRRVRRHMQMVFQDPHASLDARMRVHDIVEEPLVIHGAGNRNERRQRVAEVLELVGIDPASATRKPHAFSGGQAQRIALARALVLNPDLLILDEPVSALDVSIQAQVLNFLQDIQQEFLLTYLFIVHDLVVAEYFCDRVAVLYLGAVAELADSQELFRNPLHPYTVSLVSAVPVPDPERPRRGARLVLSGEVTPVGQKQQGCRFRARCPLGGGRSRCLQHAPDLREHTPGHWVACHFPGELRTPN